VPLPACPVDPRAPGVPPGPGGLPPGGRCEVAVVGGGLVGAAAALALARDGWDPCWVAPPEPERPDEVWDARLYALSPASRRWLEAIGAWEGVDPARTCDVLAMRVSGDDGQSQIVFDATDAREPRLATIVEARGLARGLDRALSRESCVRVDARVTTLVREVDRARLQLSDGGELAARLVVAADRRPLRVEKMLTGFGRLDADRIVTLVADATQPAIAPVDAVLVDVPCTGTGTFRRHPDARWRLRVADLAVLGALQREILEAAATVVRPGGLLVYSTCSLEPEENDAPVDRFLAAHPAFTLEPPPAGTVPATVLDGGRLRVLPQRHGTDGAFAVRLRRAP